MSARTSAAARHEVAGEIHGIIGRESAWQKWNPYGERVDYDSALTADSMQSDEALQLLVGANEDDQSEIYYDFLPEETDENTAWYAGILNVDLSNPQLLQILLRSHDEQQKNAAKIREETANEAPNRLKRLGVAVQRLHKDGLLSKAHLEAVESWLLSPDGQPLLQTAPMSQLEFARIFKRYNKEEAALNMVGGMDFSLGVIRTVARLQANYRQYTDYIHTHEQVHGYLSGLEIHDITRVDGWRRPVATAVGLMIAEPSVDIVAADDYSKVLNMELNEGVTEYITSSLQQIDPYFGIARGEDDSYSKWAKIVGVIRKKYPAVFRSILDANFAEATAAEPEAKREAIANMHAHADSVFGTQGALTKLFQENGGDILEVYKKGATSGQSSDAEN